MKDRTAGSAPISDNRPTSRKGDPFDPPPGSGGPVSDDRPVPPHPYDVETAPPSRSSHKGKK